MPRQADASKARIERINTACDALTQVQKDWDNRFTFERPDLLKRYLDGRINVYLAIGVQGLPEQINPVSLYAILDSPREAAGGRRGQLGSKVGFGTNRDGVAEDQSVGDHDQQPVFVCNVEIMDNLQNRIGRVRRPVWLHSFYKGPRRAGDTLYYSVLHGPFKFLRRIANGKNDPFGVRYSVLAGECPNDVIETRSKLMGDLASKDRNSQRDRRSQDLESVSATFRLTLSDDRIIAAVQESGDLTIEITDLLVGPLDLGPAPVEGV